MQRDLPAYVVQEYCRPDRSFAPKPAFTETSLPRTCTFFNYRHWKEEQFFPIVISDNAGLGVDVTLARGGLGKDGYASDRDSIGGRGGNLSSILDLEAITVLDEVSNLELLLSRSMHPLANDRDRPGLWRW